MRCKMPGLNEDNTFYQNHFLEIKKWQEEQVRNLRSMQKAQMAKLEEDRKRMDALLRGPIGMFPSYTGREACKKPLTHEVTTSSAEDNQSHEHVQVKKVSEIRDAIIEDETNNEINGVTATPAVGTASSFEEMIEQQMLKLQMDDKEKDDTNIVKKKPKQPFLKKRSGLQKYMSKSTSTKPSRNAKVKSTLPASNLTLKPAIRKKESVQKSAKVHFNLPEEQGDINILPSAYFGVPKPVAETVSEESSKQKHDNCVAYEEENNELKEFELLESAAQNASFSSESSFLQEVLYGNSVQENPTAASSETTDAMKDAAISVNSAKLAEYINELEIRKKHLEEQLLSFDDSSLDLDVRTSEVNAPNLTSVSSNENCPSVSEESCEILNTEHNRNLNCDAVSSSSGSSVINSDINASVVAVCGPDETMLKEHLPGDPADGICIAEAKQNVLSNAGTQQSQHSMLVGKLKELEEEISIYKENNAQLAKLNKQREEEIRALQKNREEFEKSKESEWKTMEKEIAEKRMQIKREKQTFERYQKLRKDMPGRKEREESAALKHQIVSLQDELKKQSIRSNNECKRLRKLLASAEKERDSLKLENERLEAQRLNLLEALKMKQKVSQNSSVEKIEANHVNYDLRVDDESSESKCASDKEEQITEVQPDTVPKHHVRFNLEPNVQNYSPSDSAEMNYHEIHHPDKVERIYKNGQKQIYYPSGTTEYISADGLHQKFVYYNGDTKEIYPDKRMVYKFFDGTVETHYPDGLQVFEYTNQQVERYYPDGTKQIIFANGTYIVLYSDGAQEVHRFDGIVMKSFTDGMHAVEYPSGDKEFRTGDYVKREFANGTVRTVYKSGRIETIYSDGRLKVKNKNGEVILNVK